MGLVEDESAVGDALALTEQASEVRQLLQVQAKAREEQRSHRVQFQAQLDVVRGEATGLLAALAAAETENEQLREDAAARIELVRAVSERVGSLKQLALSDAAAAVGTARLIKVDAELAVAKQDVARLQTALDAAIATHQQASDAQTTTQLDDTRRVESLQLDLRHALRSLRSAQQAAAERESRQLSALKAAESAAAQPLHAELVTLAQQVHAYEKAALEQARAIEEEDAGQKVVVADAERLRMEVAEQAEQIAEMRVRAADRSSVAEGFNAQLQSSNGALQASLASVESVKAQLASFQATSVSEAIGICSEQPSRSKPAGIVRAMAEYLLISPAFLCWGESTHLNLVWNATEQDCRALMMNSTHCWVQPWQMLMPPPPAATHCRQLLMMRARTLSWLGSELQKVPRWLCWWPSNQPPM